MCCRLCLFPDPSHAFTKKLCSILFPTEKCPSFWDVQRCLGTEDYDEEDKENFEGEEEEFEDEEFEEKEFKDKELKDEEEFKEEEEEEFEEEENSKDKEKYIEEEFLNYEDPPMFDDYPNEISEEANMIYGDVEKSIVIESLCEVEYGGLVPNAVKEFKMVFQDRVKKETKALFEVYVDEGRSKFPNKYLAFLINSEREQFIVKLQQVDEHPSLTDELWTRSEVDSIEILSNAINDMKKALFGYVFKDAHDKVLLDYVFENEIRARTSSTIHGWKMKRVVKIEQRIVEFPLLLKPPKAPTDRFIEDMEPLNSWKNSLFPRGANATHNSTRSWFLPKMHASFFPGASSS